MQTSRLSKTPTKKPKTPTKKPKTPTKSSSRTPKTPTKTPLRRQASISLRKFKDKRSHDQTSLKRSGDDDDSQSTCDSGVGSDECRKKFAANPFQKADMSDANSLVSSPMTRLEASSLVNSLRMLEDSRSVPSNETQRLELEEQIRTTTNDTRVPVQMFVPYKDFLDLSLKTKLRITMPGIFEWPMVSGNTEIQARGKTAGKAGSPWDERWFSSLLRYWIFPYFSGVEIFPPPETSSSAENLNGLDFVVGLQKDWEVSLLDLADSVAKGRCPFFYIVTHQWTAVVIGKGTGGIDKERAYIVPTGKGFRAVLVKKGLRFRLPLKNMRKMEAGPSDELLLVGNLRTVQMGDRFKPQWKEYVADPTLDTSGHSGDLLGENTSSFSWIKENCVRLGKFAEENQDEILEDLLDYRPESLVAFDGSEAIKFLKGLAKNKSMQPTGGALLNLPPVLIAPVEFANATLKRLKYSCVESRDLSYFELSEGPIMPHVAPCLAGMFTANDPKTKSAAVHFTTLEKSSVLAKVTAPSGAADLLPEQWESAGLSLGDALPSEAGIVNVEVLAKMSSFRFL